MEKSTLFGIMVFLVVIIGGMFITNSESSTITGNTVNNDDNNKKVRHIVIDAKWFEFNPDKITIKQGENVMLMINNIDVLHGINIPELGLRGSDVIEFTADKKGEFDFYCDNFCGEGHREMVGKIIVE